MARAWMSTQSPGSAFSSASRPTLMTAQQVPGIAAGRQAHGDVGLAAEHGDLPGEDDINSDVGAERGQHGRVAGQAERGQWPRSPVA
jgi:hypothetical protein